MSSEPFTLPDEFATELKRIADALERLAPKPRPYTNLGMADAFVWHADGGWLSPVPHVNRVEMGLLRGIDRVRDQLNENTERFARGLPANNALLWGARGMGKSSLVKAAHAEALTKLNGMAGLKPLKLVEIHREDIESLPALMAIMRDADCRFIVFCDDLSFDANDTSYKSLKAVLEGGIEGRPDNVIFYATSNRRHLLPRDMMDNERGTAINPGEAIEEKVSLSKFAAFSLHFNFDVKKDLASDHMSHSVFLSEVRSNKDSRTRHKMKLFISFVTKELISICLPKETTRFLIDIFI